MKEPTIRIGDKNKSVRIKRYLFDFYCLMTDKTEEEGKEAAERELQDSIKNIGSKATTADQVMKYLLLEISSLKKT